MKNTLSTLILVFVAMVCMSTTGCWGREHDVCEDAPRCESTELGLLKLGQADTAAIPFQGNETVTFVNPQGFQAVYKAQGYKTDTDERLVITEEICYRCQEYYLKEQRSLTFSGQNLNFGFSYHLVKNVPENAQGIVIPDPNNSGNVLKITVGQVTFAVPLGAAPIEINAVKQFKLHNSLKLGSKTYSQVYEVFMLPSDYSNAGYTLPKQIFYTQPGGLVGYTLTNNEQWVKQ